MNPLSDLPPWAALLTAVLVLFGAGLTLIGSVGVVGLKSFYQRCHAPTLGTSLGAAAILLASMLCFSILQSRPVLHEILILVFISVTTPITLVLLVRAALFRDRRAGHDEVAATMLTPRPVATAESEAAER